MVTLDPSHFDQILMNLAVNARDAMSGGGRLRLATRPRNVQPVSGGDRWVELAVEDTGIGMTPEVQARIFEPFFTTKGVGKGTGLGLSTVFGIVKQLGGHVSVDSAPGRGTTFRLLFQPAIASSPELPTEAPSAPGLAATARILVVEDDPAVRRNTVRMLEQSGYSVVEASSGPQGLELALGGAFDLVLTDLMLPGLLGDELAARLADARPGLPVIFVSGDSDSHIRRLPEGARLIVKPFSRADLSRELGLVLAATRRIARETQMDEGAAA